MAYADYRLCDLCQEKAFYDSNLNYETPEWSRSDDKFTYPENPFKIQGEEQPQGNSLDRLGDWVVLCQNCSKTHRCVIQKIDHE